MIVVDKVYSDFRRVLLSVEQKSNRSCSSKLNSSGNTIDGFSLIYRRFNSFLCIDYSGFSGFGSFSTLITSLEAYSVATFSFAFGF